MKIFLDTANTEEIRKGAEWGIVDGVEERVGLFSSKQTARGDEVAGDRDWSGCLAEQFRTRHGHVFGLLLSMLAATAGVMSAAAIGRSGTAVVFINQLREKIGIIFGNPEVTPGGRALKFYSSVRLDLRRIETIKQGNVAMGSRVRAKVVKNKVAPPFRTAEFDIMFDSGISSQGNLIDLGVSLELLKKSGAFFSYGDIRLGQGRESAKQYLKQNPELAQELEEKIRASAVTGQIASSRG